MTRQVIVALLVPCLLCCAKAGAPPRDARPDRRAQAHATPDAARHEASGGAASRHLDDDASFGQLVQRVAALEPGGDDTARPGCLLQGRGTPERPFVLAADLAPAVRPLPDPPRSLPAASASEARTPVVLTRWGALSGATPEPSGPAFAALTSIPPTSMDQPFLVVWAGARQTRILPAATPDPAEPPPASWSVALVSRVRALEQAGARPTVFVTATAQVPLTQLRELLAAIPETAVAALAVPLPPDTRLDLRTSAAPDDSAGAAGLCPEGLPPAPDTRPEGALSADAIVAGLAPMRDAAAHCLAQASGPAARGGRITLAARIGPHGRVERACVTETEMADPVLRGCLLEHLRGLALQAPSPAGFVDFALPLRLVPAPAPPQRPLCAP